MLTPAALTTALLVLRLHAGPGRRACVLSRNQIKPLEKFAI